MHFIRTCGHIVVHCRHLDIVQLALQQPKNSSVYNDALELAKKAKEKFYLEWLVFYLNSIFLRLISYKLFYFI